MRLFFNLFLTSFSMYCEVGCWLAGAAISCLLVLSAVGIARLVSLPQLYKTPFASPDQLNVFCWGGDFTFVGLIWIACRSFPHFRVCVLFPEMKSFCLSPREGAKPVGKLRTSLRDFIIINKSILLTYFATSLDWNKSVID